MKNYAKYLLGVVVMMSLTACGGSSEGGGKKPEVTFTTEIISRADSELKTAFSNGDRMSVYRTATNSITGAAPSIHAATYGNGVWQPTPSITLAKEERCYLFAIYPYNADATDATAYPVTVASQTDYLYSGTGVAASNEVLSPVLRMRHAMARLALNIHSYAGGTLQSISIESTTLPIEGSLRVTGSITPTKFGAYSKSFNTPLSQQGFSTDHPGIFIIPYQTPNDGVKVKVTISGTAYELNLPATNFTGGKKYVATVLHTAQGLVLEKGEYEVIGLDEPSNAKNDPYSILKVKVQGETALAPVIEGQNLYGFIYWGDNSQESYSPTGAHSYDTAGEHVVTVDAWNAETVTLPKLTNITEIDLSKF